MAHLLQRGKIDDQIANRDAGTRVAILRLKNTERKVLQWKMRIR